MISLSEVLHKQDLAPFNHEEAHTKIFVHIKHAAACRHRLITIRTVDTNVAVLVISNFTKLQVNELWIAFGE